MDVQSQEEPDLVKEVAGPTRKLRLKEILLPAGIILVIILAGGITGWFLANRGGLPVGPTQIKQLTGGAELIQGPKEVGIKDVETFRDTAEGKIEVNENSNIPEGSHKLIRPGGASQTAYLTSSVVDLNQFLGKCVQVWGETFAAQKVGWLMDVGRVKILDQCPAGI
ncbi:hypothetical protein CO054_01295 [Candidatus Shapirobacteria bacterium CG_4_9_14_0_2_um_filter_39_11]|uniref:Uncharacterized protein n=1 Tax=Candidatus Shapirobacteria bacterium CG_4_9_14_0_2_um_filter_39_11 TaxID=1974478 RepID=A0A2M8ESX0_9BACT|nr:MAG: hypothetical protein CO054_01295 [Candidatus Shapirobacteria bacterium CG_4_9_14_0_2_um_filter_39_11]